MKFKKLSLTDILAIICTLLVMPEPILVGATNHFNRYIIAFNAFAIVLFSYAFYNYIKKKEYTKGIMCLNMEVVIIFFTYGFVTYSSMI